MKGASAVSRRWSFDQMEHMAQVAAIEEMTQDEQLDLLQGSGVNFDPFTRLVRYYTSCARAEGMG